MATKKTGAKRLAELAGAPPRLATAEDLEAAGNRIWNISRMYWVREIEGFGRDWDMPARRFYEEPPKTGATAGQITKYEDVIRLLDMYYEQRGWTPTGLPTPATLERLGLNSLVA